MADLLCFQTENSTDGNVGVIELKTRKLTWLLESPRTKPAPCFRPMGAEWHLCRMIRGSPKLTCRPSKQAKRRD